MVSITVMCSSTSWLKSLSPLEIITSMACREAMQASVPITSSASTPGTAMTFQPSISTTACTGSIWLRKSGGIGERLAL